MTALSASAALFAGHVGPNAVSQLGAALLARWGAEAAYRVFARAGELGWLERPPAAMVPQERVARLHAALREELPRAQALEAARDAGERTAHYLLANRIPRPAQLLMRWLPGFLAARVLLAMIRRNAWTFAGSGRIVTQVPDRRTGRGWIEIHDNPLAANPCSWHEGVFTTLFATLAAPTARVRETECGGGQTGSCCHFDIELVPGIVSLV